MKATTTPFLAPLFALLASGLASACKDYRDCSMVDASAALALPSDLGATGLYEDGLGGPVSAEAVSFTPRFPLWSDGSEKRRWLVLPQGTQVDTSTPDVWEFPVGTKAFKEFTRDGVRVETRLIERTDTGWAGTAYAWNEAQTGAPAVLAGRKDVLGTAHDVPSAEQCLACHAGKKSFILGFSALQLTSEERERLFEDGLLSDPVPGDPTLSTKAMAGLGVLHANCSHCHTAERSTQPHATECFDPGTALDFSLPYLLPSLDAAPAVQTATAQLGRPKDSKVLRMMGRRSDAKLSWPMPPLGTEQVDDVGRAAVLELLKELEATR